MRRDLYPAVEAFDSFQLPVSELHSVHVEQAGNPQGKPVVFVHGGPGGGCDAKHRRFFDPARYRIILFDQRGCGRSTPHACLEENTTWHLVEDMERIRQRLGVERWMVFGGSWGSTLGLAYAEKHPERVSEMVLRGIFLLRKREIDWFYQEGTSRMFPEAWDLYLNAIPQAERGDLLGAYHRRLTDPDPAVRVAAARAWSTWEGRTSCLLPNAELVDKMGADLYATAFARIECHYFMNKGFFEHDDQLLRDAHRLAAIPGVIVQGRYDVVCPAESAWALHKVWPTAQLRIVHDAGHSAYEPGIASELIAATDGFAARR